MTCANAAPRVIGRSHFRALLDAHQAVLVANPTTAVTTQVSNLSYEVDTRNSLQRIKYEPSGWNYWDWEWAGEKRKVHFIKAGRQGDPVVVLVHGYGASSYHWRYNVPALAEAGYQVYAVDLLGFGYSEKARVDYTNAEAWTSQVMDFIRMVVGPSSGPVVLAGNSLGGYVALATAAQASATHRSDPQQQPQPVVRAVALLNGAGPFRDNNAATGKTAEQEAAEWADQSCSLKRAVMFFAFQRTKQPARIREVLQLVYVDHTSIDDDLVTSIETPAQDPAASEVFFLVSHSTRGPPRYVDDLLEQLGGVPLLLLWGDKDPWITPAKATKIQSLYPSAVKVGLDSGHCPHDDTPDQANKALLQWLESLPPIDDIPNPPTTEVSSASAQQ
ncbi:hypothetical protein VOLCADRAFT_103462 [Volvox carteri f. nagariensis]|uniref:AB hydrolase-1 domain-containing protein n=1 Tax=Volvox carteri f. nagariensis TaxID=3068 RepID=D8TM21_VOLCA|nr:uncharacterized protein VOLCADRAFT_103462 [Volvox carteri f. nagariensis]EFJ51431.1 hypothetical protein VOLCADRAFT_103462 [Volvox carteri f. nagariensis]|eukprot:XP_002947383.1 hypothetical protein VOLCADRAFT_103462 [Volvox carteri f. nagariensis]